MCPSAQGGSSCSIQGLTLPSHLGSCRPASVFVINAQQESALCLKCLLGFWFPAGHDWCQVILDHRLHFQEVTQARKGGALGVRGGSTVLNTLLFSPSLPCNMLTQSIQMLKKKKKKERRSCGFLRLFYFPDHTGEDPRRVQHL